VGVLTPGPRVAAVRGQLVVYRDGLPIGSGAADRVTAAVVRS